MKISFSGSSGILYYILFYRRIWVWYSPYWSSGTAPIWRISHKDPPVKEYIEFVLLCMWYSYSQRGWISLREEYFIFREEYFISREVYLNHCVEVLLSKNEVLLSEWYLSSLRIWISHAQEYKFYILFYRRIFMWYSPYWSSGTAPRLQLGAVPAENMANVTLRSDL